MATQTERLKSFLAHKSKPLRFFVTDAAHQIRRNSLVEDWIVPISQPVLWIYQPGRSGGTLLLRLFDRHPELHVRPRPLGFGLANGWPDDPLSVLPQLRKAFSMSRFNRRGIRKGASNKPQIVVPTYFDEHWYRTILRDRLRDANTGRHVFDALHTASLNAWRNNQNLHGPKRFVVFHTAPGFQHRFGADVPKFLKTYPDGFMLFVARKPEDWLASAVDLQHANKYTDRLEDALHDYVRFYKALPNDELGRVIVLEFDRLVQDSEQVLRNLCDRVGISFSEALRVTTMNGIPMVQNTSHDVPDRSVPDPSVTGKGQELRAAIAQRGPFKEAEHLYQAAIERSL